MVATHYAGKLDVLYPEIKVHSVSVALAGNKDKDAVGIVPSRNKKPIGGFVPGETYYIPPTIFDKYRTREVNPLTSPFVKALPGVGSRAPVVIEDDLCVTPIEDMNAAFSSAFLLKHFYHDYIAEIEVLPAIAAAERIIQDFSEVVTKRIAASKRLIYVFDARVFSDYHVSPGLDKVEFEMFDSKGRSIPPNGDVYDVCPAYDRLFVTLTSGNTPIKYEMFFHMVGDRPDVDFVRVEIGGEVASTCLYLDDADSASVLSSERLYRDILKSPFKDCIARYVHNCKASPIQVFEGGYEPDNLMPSEEVGLAAGASLLSKYLNIHDGEARSYMDYVQRMDEVMQQRKSGPVLVEGQDTSLVAIPNANPFA